MSQTIIAPTKVGPYVLRGTIGEGAFSVVKLAFHEQYQKYCACKIVPLARLGTSKQLKSFQQEIRITQQLHHPGIAQLIDVLSDNFNYYIMMEFCPGGELLQHILSRGHLPENEAQHFSKQILEAIRYIHSMGVSHRDLKPENLLFDATGHLKISDFGLSRFMMVDYLASTPCGSPCYTSPECLTGKPYDGRLTDVWSIGVIVYAMLNGKLPWTKRTPGGLFQQIKAGDFQLPDTLSLAARTFVKGLLEVNPAQRLTVEQALNHPWLATTPEIGSSSSPSFPMVSIRKIDSIFEKHTNSELDFPNPNQIKRLNSSGAKNFESVTKSIQVTNPELDQNIRFGTKTSIGKPLSEISKPNQSAEEVFRMKPDPKRAAKRIIAYGTANLPPLKLETSQSNTTYSKKAKVVHKVTSCYQGVTGRHFTKPDFGTSLK